MQRTRREITYKKVEEFLLDENKNYSLAQACGKAGISLGTYYNYRNVFSDEKYSGRYIYKEKEESQRGGRVKHNSDIEIELIKSKPKKKSHKSSDKTKVPKEWKKDFLNLK